MNKLAKLVVIAALGCLCASEISAMNYSDELNETNVSASGESQIDEGDDLSDVVRDSNLSVKSLKEELYNLTIKVTELIKSNRALWRDHLSDREREVIEYIIICSGFDKGVNDFIDWLNCVVDENKTEFTADDLKNDVKPFLDDYIKHDEKNLGTFSEIFGGAFNQLSDAISNGINITPELRVKLSRLLNGLRAELLKPPFAVDLLQNDF